MAKSEGTTTLAVAKEYGDRVREIADEMGMKYLDFTNCLLKSALENEIEIEVEVKVKKIKLSPRKRGRQLIGEGGEAN